MAGKNKGLGRGLDALIPTYQNEQKEEQSGIIHIGIDQIKANKDQPRKHFAPEKIQELSDSIKIHGIIQPILVVESNGAYTIVAGERRYRAAVSAGLKEIPVIIKEFTEEEILQIALIENLQREDLNSIEEALAYKQLLDNFAMTQEQISEKIGKSRTAVANTLRLLGLSDKIQKYIIDKRLSAGHARAILSLQDNKLQEAFAEYILENQLSVRESEKASKDFQINRKKTTYKKKHISKEPYIIDLEDTLCQKFGTKVRIISNGKKGKIELEYYSNEDLERLIFLLDESKEI